MSKTVLWIATAGTLVLLAWHALEYGFLTDDAYISFRYAANLSSGDGLVFNPGFERVEGYTNFLWVLLLALCAKLGWAPDSAANPLLLIATLVLFAAVVRFAARNASGTYRALAVLIPALFLAATRSFAVWSTSGLETRLFELLVVTGTLRLVSEVRALREGDRVRSWAALSFALATLTRPDGLLIAASVYATLLFVNRKLLAERPGWIARSAGIYAGLVGAHFLFRWFYYGEWLPNTFYARVGAGPEWEAGRAYLELFALEYGVYLWVPLLLAAVAHHRSRGTLQIPALFAAVCLPHALYIAALGGDHFEFRPLDLYFPFFYLLLADGLVFLARSCASSRSGSIAATLYASVVFVGIIALPLNSHTQAPDHYLAGFPGNGREPERTDYLDPDRCQLYALPGLRTLATLHRDRLRVLSSQFIGLRQEEHRLFHHSVLAEGRLIGRLVADGTLPPSTHLAISCVGVIPYYSGGLRVLDRHGLTDAQVAHRAPSSGLLAHDKVATPEYARGAGVDLWAVDGVHLIWESGTPEFERMVALAITQQLDIHVAPLGDRRFLVARLLQGIEHATARFPALRFRSMLSPDAFDAR